MKRLVTLNNPRMAQAFIDYMASRQIDIEMMPEGEGQTALWLTDSQHEVEAEAELKQFWRIHPLANTAPLPGTLLILVRANFITLAQASWE